MSSDDKEQQQQPSFVIAAPEAKVEPGLKSRLTRKHVLIAIVSLIVTALVVVGVVLSVHIYTDSSVEVLKYQLKMKDKDNHDVEQDVSTDANAVQYHVVKEGVEAWILQDFDKDIELSKVITDNGVSCYLAALNRSNAEEPSTIPSTAPTPGDDTPSTQLIYTVSETPVKDISFLGKRANKLCSNIPTYWMVPSCGDAVETLPSNTTEDEADDDDGRSKRATVCGSYRRYPCVCGCCWRVCGVFASSRYTWYYSRGRYYCTYRMYYLRRAFYLGRRRCYYRRRRYYYPWS